MDACFTGSPFGPAVPAGRPKRAVTGANAARRGLEGPHGLIATAGCLAGCEPGVRSTGGVVAACEGRPRRLYLVPGGGCAGGQGWLHGWVRHDIPPCLAALAQITQNRLHGLMPAHMHVHYIAGIALREGE
jgi:hypothetical protein